jgi:hypothetical protein
VLTQSLHNGYTRYISYRANSSIVACGPYLAKAVFSGSTVLALRSYATVFRMSLRTVLLDGFEVLAALVMMESIFWKYNDM